ncbi:DUF397 domain-containing protein [Nocardiopsis sediminis]|uniref:DUF397 domain-containing protein n=1 Tax=Nocardiopsis sediminis TaxID=1778267 RepID=A0ABV8FDX9_9ACTN
MAQHDAWHKSSYSESMSNCVEVAEGPVTRIRDTQHRGAAVLAVPAREWVALVADLGRL